MTQVFLRILNGSLAAGWVALGVLLLRLLFKKAPKWISCLLWAVVALRLLIPVGLQSSFSLLPSAQVIPTDIVTATTPAIESGIPAVDSAVNPLFTGHLAPQTQLLPQLVTVAGWIWLAGVGIMLLLLAVSWLRLRWQLRISLPLEKNVYICDSVGTPFVFGVLRPRIYLPSTMAESQHPYVLAHERAHIRRKDHWWKLLGYLLLSVYWFNPLLWVSYILLCRDIEQACDDKVIKTMDATEKQHYSEALLACSQSPRLVSVCPVAFGEVGVKTRIRGILNYKKPAFWVMIASCLAVAVAAGCFLTDPIPCDHTYESAVTQASTCTATGVQTNTCSLCHHSYTEGIAMIAHTYESAVTQASTCTAAGVLTNTCSACSHSYTEGIPLVAHPYDDGKVITAATCTQVGTLERSCTQCSHTNREPILLAEHTLGEPYCSEEPNCTTEGKNSAQCSQCEEVFVTEILPKNDVHDFQLTVNVAATCTAKGQGTNTCTRCARTERVTLALKDHNYKLGFQIEGTCIQAGMKEWVCTVCSKSKVVSTGYGSHSYRIDSFGKRCCRYCASFEPGS